MVERNIVKKDVINKLCFEFGLKKKEATQYYNQIIETMIESIIQNERIELRGFGTFTVKKLKGFEGVNPSDQSKITVPERYTVNYKPARDLKVELNKYQKAKNSD